MLQGRILIGPARLDRKLKPAALEGAALPVSWATDLLQAIRADPNAISIARIADCPPLLSHYSAGQWPTVAARIITAHEGRSTATLLDRFFDFWDILN